jgi:hypothetical protein
MQTSCCHHPQAVQAAAVDDAWSRAAWYCKSVAIGSQQQAVVNPADVDLVIVNSTGLTSVPLLLC